MKNILNLYEQHCIEHGVSYTRHESVLSYDDTTLFCPAGMQQYKQQYGDPDFVKTLGNCQSCLRLVDLDDIDDDTHYLYFNMIGLFSFRQWSVKQTIDFWMSFLTKKLGLRIDYVTLHPDRMEWQEFYREYPVEIRSDTECVWGDGEQVGYCTEFYINGVEIGNIVNTCGTSIDVGFGLERLESFVNPDQSEKTGEQVLKDTITRLLTDGVIPSNKKQGYVLRKLMRKLLNRGGTFDHILYDDERKKQERMVKEYHRYKERHKDKSREWWLDTFGVDIDLL